jgi:hypothetical protein
MRNKFRNRNKNRFFKSSLSMAVQNIITIFEMEVVIPYL